jgi:hypothetical protein
MQFAVVTEELFVPTHAAVHASPAAGPRCAPPPPPRSPHARRLAAGAVTPRAHRRRLRPGPRRTSRGRRRRSEDAARGAGQDDAPRRGWRGAGRRRAREAAQRAGRGAGVPARHGEAARAGPRRGVRAAGGQEEAAGAGEGRGRRWAVPPPPGRSQAAGQQQRAIGRRGPEERRGALCVSTVRQHGVARRVVRGRWTNALTNAKASERPVSAAARACHAACVRCDAPAEAATTSYASSSSCASGCCCSAAPRALPHQREVHARQVHRVRGAAACRPGRRGRQQRHRHAARRVAEEGNVGRSGPRKARLEARGEGARHGRAVHVAQQARGQRRRLARARGRSGAGQPSGMWAACGALQRQRVTRSCAGAREPRACSPARRRASRRRSAGCPVAPRRSEATGAAVRERSRERVKACGVVWRRARLRPARGVAVKNGVHGACARFLARGSSATRRASARCCCLVSARQRARRGPTPKERHNGRPARTSGAARARPARRSRQGRPR